MLFKKIEKKDFINLILHAHKLHKTTSLFPPTSYKNMSIVKDLVYWFNTNELFENAKTSKTDNAMVTKTSKTSKTDNAVGPNAFLINPYDFNTGEPFENAKTSKTDNAVGPNAFLINPYDFNTGEPFENAKTSKTLAAMPIDSDRYVPRPLCNGKFMTNV